MDTKEQSIKKQHSGLRARVGNIQIGENTLFLDQYHESRFNAWTIGELHILSPKLVPNGRRDDFEKIIFIITLLITYL